MADRDKQRATRRSGSEAGRRRVEPGNGSTPGNGARPHDQARRAVSRVDAPTTPEMPATFRRVDNGSPVYRGTVPTNQGYSPTLYRFSRVRANEVGRPTNMWLMLLVLLGVAVALLLVAALPGLLSRGGNAAPASPSASSAASQFEVPLTSDAPTPTTFLSPSASVGAPSFRTYTVKAGDTLTRIANKFGLKTWELRLANPSLDKPNSLKIGQVLNIPEPGQLTPPP
jgi:LysM repeat protein